MTRSFGALVATTAIVAAGPVFAEAHGGMSVCENAFISADADDDNVLSQEEIAELRDAEFEQIDANDDGTITRNEYRTCIGKADEAMRAGAEGRQADWLDFEVLEDQEQMTGEEYMESAADAFAADTEEAWSMYTFAGQPADAADEEAFAKAAIDRFQAQDQNGDNVLSREEYETTAWAEKFDEEALDRRFNALDEDGSENISPQEYRAAGTRAFETGILHGQEEQEADEAAAEAGVPVMYYYYFIAI